MAQRKLPGAMVSLPPPSLVIIRIEPQATRVQLSYEIYGPLREHVELVTPILQAVARQIEMDARSPGLLVPEHLTPKGD